MERWCSAEASSPSLGSLGCQDSQPQGVPSLQAQAPASLRRPPSHTWSEVRLARKSLVASSGAEARSPPWGAAAWQVLLASAQLSVEVTCL